MKRNHRMLPVAGSLLLLAGCFELNESDMLPRAYAGEDQRHAEVSSTTITLDGTDSTDPDGEIVAYEWRYTGDPRGDEAPEDDAGTDMPGPLEMLGFEPRPDFCPEPEPREGISIPPRWCELEPAGEAVIELEVGTGVHRFTLWVTDDAGNVGADSVVVHVGDTPYTPTAE
ncbi:MAG: hypothetical protein PVI30_14265 [Myxococcales bacterium]|jgi:hypothetical protein